MVYNLLVSMRVGLISPCDNFTQASYDNIKTQNAIEIAQQAWIELVRWKHVFDPIDQSPISARVDDLHEMYSDTSIDVIWLLKWGFASNEMLPYINRDLIKNNPKPLCGFSDATALQNAIYTHTGQQTISWPFFQTIGRPLKWQEVFLDEWKKVFIDKISQVQLAKDRPYLDYNSDGTPNKMINEPLKIINPWIWQWPIIWGNLSTFSLLFNTPHMPSFDWKILFLEECYEHNIGFIRRQLFHLKQQPYFDKLAGIVIGRIQQACLTDYNIDREKTIRQFAEWLNMPVLMNWPFWHISPFQIFPIGGSCSIENEKVILTFHAM